MNSFTIEPELNSLLVKLTTEIENDSKQVELLKKKIVKNEELLRAVKGRLGMTTGNGKSGYGSKMSIVRDAIKSLLKPQFTQNDVEAEIKSSNSAMEINRNRIRAALWTLADKKEIRLIRSGNNQEAAIYEKIEGIVRFKRITEEHKSQTLENAARRDVTAALLEDAIRTKSGRIEHLAERLKTDESTIKSLLEPASKAYVGSAGWLRLRE